MKRRAFSILLTIFLLIPVALKGQPSGAEQRRYQIASQELERVIGDADKLDDPLAMVKVKAKAATLLWRQSPERARALFLSLWDFIDQQKEKTFDKESARIALLRHLYPKDSTLANQLLQKLAVNTQGKNVSSYDKVSGRDPESMRRIRLSMQLGNADSALAARVLEQSLERGVHPAITSALAQLRESDPLLANYVVARGLESLKSLPRSAAISGLGYLIAYVFPLMPLPAPSREVEESDENLRVQVMSVGYPLLKASLAESDEYLVKEQQFTAESLQYRSIQLACVAATLAAMAPRYAPQLTTELYETSRRVLASLPPALTQMVSQAAQTQAAAAAGSMSGETGEMAIIPAFAKGDFGKAQGLIDELKDEARKKVYTQFLLKAQFRTYLAAAELQDALRTARKMEDTSEQMLMLATVAKAANKAGDKTLAAQVLNEARTIPVNSTLKGRHARALFFLAAEASYVSATDAGLVLQEAVKQVNSLVDSDKTSGEGTSRVAAIVNDPARFVDSSEMMSAFAALGAANLEDTLLAAGRLENKAVQMTARLAAVEKTLSKPPVGVTPKPKPATPATKNNP